MSVCRPTESTGAMVPACLFWGRRSAWYWTRSHAFGRRAAAPWPPGADGDPQLHLALPQTAAPEQIRDAVQAWLMRQAKSLFQERLDHFAPQLQVSVAQTVAQQCRYALGQRAGAMAQSGCIGAWCISGWR